MIICKITKVENSYFLFGARKNGKSVLNSQLQYLLNKIK